MQSLCRSGRAVYKDTAQAEQKRSNKMPNTRLNTSGAGTQAGVNVNVALSHPKVDNSYSFILPTPSFISL